MLKAGKERAASDGIETNTQMIESKLQEMGDEMKNLEREQERIELLFRKKSWINYDIQLTYFQSLKDSSDLLKEQSHEVHQQHLSFESKIAIKRPLKHFQ